MEENTPMPQAPKSNTMPILIGLFVVIILGVLGGVFVLKKAKAPQQTSVPQQVADATPTPQGVIVNVTQEVSPSGSSMTNVGKPTLESKEPGGGQGAATVKTFNVVASNFQFNPASITVKTGDSVKVVLTSSGGAHNFAIDEFNVHSKVISSGETDTVSFVANKSGTFEYYCSIGNHRQMGMVGKLVVL